VNVVVLGFAALTLSCAAADVTPAIPVDAGALERFCCQCRQTQSASLRCTPDIAEACAVLTSDLKRPGRRVSADEASRRMSPPYAGDSEGVRTQRRPYNAPPG
jgi:hypothetical protein